MLVRSKPGLINSAGRLTDAARRTTHPPRARSNCTTEALLLSMPTAAGGKRGLTNLCKGFDGILASCQLSVVSCQLRNSRIQLTPNNEHLTFFTIHCTECL